MNKCSFCNHSINKNGNLVCPHSFCVLTRLYIEDMLEKLARIKFDD